MNPLLNHVVFVRIVIGCDDVKSMTGFGSARIHKDNMEISAEIKSVNQRFFDYQVRLFQSNPQLEDEIARKIKKAVVRGKVEVFVRLEGSIETNPIVHVDEGLVDQYIEAFRKIRQKEKDALPLDINQLLLNQSIVQVYEEDSTFVGHSDILILQAIDEALRALVQMREQEGVELFTIIETEMNKLVHHSKCVEEAVPRLLDSSKERIKGQIRTLVESHEIDESRVLTEVAIIADKMDITEEIVRLKSHIKQFFHYCHLKEPIGRRLDFLVQEMNREVNTIGSKASDSFIRQEVVEMKGNLEKVKEQVQNIE